MRELTPDPGATRRSGNHVNASDSMNHTKIYKVLYPQFYPRLHSVKRCCLMLVKCWLCASDFAQRPDRLWHTKHHWLRRDHDKLATRHVKSRFPNEPLKLCLKANIGNFRILEVLYLQILWGYSPT